MMSPCVFDIHMDGVVREEKARVFQRGVKLWDMEIDGR